MSDERIIHDEDGRPHRAKLAGRTEGPFPETAEALGIATDLIMAVHTLKGGRFTVIYTPDYPHDETTWLALLGRRLSDGTLRVISRERRPEIGRAIRADLERKLGGAPE